MINLPKKRACNLNYFFKLILVVLLLALPIVNASDVVVQSGNLNISNNIYFDSTGKVGIGTTSPLAALDVRAPTGSSQVLSGASGSYTSIQIGRTAAEGTWGIAAAAGHFSTDAAAGDIILRTESSSNKLILNSGIGAATLVVSNGNVGINTTTPGQTLTVQGTLNVSASNTRASDLFVASNGNVGIGTANPITSLEIRKSSGATITAGSIGNFLNSGDLVGSVDFYNSDADIPSVAGYVRALAGPSFGVGGVLTFGTQETWSTGVLRERMRITNTGNVGIGTTSPDRPLVIQAQGTGQELVSFKDLSGATKWHINQNLGGSNPGLNFVESGVADGRLFLKAGGNVGIGTTNPSAKLDVNGKGHFSGGVDPPYISFSDESHESIRKYAKDVQAHEKAMEFWNGISHRIEIYVIAEDKFYTPMGDSITE